MRIADALMVAAALTIAGCAGHVPRPAAPTAAGVKIGKPYSVFGVTYVPSDDRSYDERGVASWYGPGFHALSTANGERYDQDGVTAAHKTLPMPSFVEVENLDNGRRLTVRVNDRGPFVAGRIIDLSRRSAQLLGVDRPGTARVRVRRVFPDGAVTAALAAPATVAPASPPVPIPATELAVGLEPPPPVTTTAIPADATPIVPSASTTFVQVAALADQGKAAWLKSYLAAFGNVVTETTATGLVRIRLGPYRDASSADAALAQVRAAGYSDARLVAPTAAKP